MTEFLCVSIILAIICGIRLLQWAVMRSEADSAHLIEDGQPITLNASSLGALADSEPTTLGATGIVPGGVSYTEPELHRARIELGNKRFGKGR